MGAGSRGTEEDDMNNTSCKTSASRARIDLEDSYWGEGPQQKVTVVDGLFLTMRTSRRHEHMFRKDQQFVLGKNKRAFNHVL